MTAKTHRHNMISRCKELLRKNFFILLVLPLLIPASFMLGLLIKYSVNLPYSDEWIIVPTFQHIDQGHLLFHDFWQIESFHRLFFTKALITVLAYFTRWNIQAEIGASFVFCLITAFLIYRFVGQTIQNRTLAFMAMLIAAFWLFSPVQSENWLWGWDVAWFMCTAGALASIYFLIRAQSARSVLFFYIAIGAAILSTFSFGWGQAIWPVGLLILLIQRQKRRPVFTWCVTALLVYGAYYFHRPGSPSSHIPILAFIHQPVNALSYYLVMFGRPFTNDIDAAMLLGSITLLLMVPVFSIAWGHRDKLKLYLPWLSLIIFSLLGAVMIILGRMTTIPHATTPLSDAMQSRYTAMPILYFIGLSGLILTLVDGFKSSKEVLKYIVLTAVVIQVPLIYSSYSIGILSSHQRNILMTRLQDCSQLPTQKVSKDCLASNNYRNALPTAKQQLQYLKDKHWAGY